MSHVLESMHEMVEDGEVDPDDMKDCAEFILELREEYPEAWAICALADDLTLRAAMEEL